MHFTNLLDYVNTNRDSSIYKTRLIYESLDGTPFRDKHLKVKLQDVEDFVKKNNVKEITNPVFFLRDGIPTPDGLLSNEIFGISKDERANIWGYIDLHGTYLHPFIYKIWGKMDNSIRNIVHGLKGYVLDKDGYIVEDIQNGETGVDFLVKNIKKINIRPTESTERKNNIEFIMNNKDRLFIKKMLVQPAFYRDVLSGKGRVEVGQLNKYYSSLLVATRSLRETQELGFSLGEATKGRVQDIVLQIFRCITGTSDNPDDGTGLAGKLGILNNALARTVDYGTRLVLSAPELKVERLEDLMTDTEHCALPLASTIINFKPFVVFAIKRYFENEFGGGDTIAVIDKTGKLKYTRVKDPRAVYSENRIEKEIKEFVYSFSNRFKPVMVTVVDENGKESEATIRFKGRSVTPQQFRDGKIYGESPLIDRALTWCDVLYMAANEATKDKCVLITRYPVDTAYNQIPQKIRISTIKNTEPVYINNTYYNWYPKIRKEDISSNTSNRFIDTCNLCNLMIEGMKADYDGDTVGIKGVWMQESNKELEKFIRSKSHYISFSGSNIRTPSHEAIQSLYSLTKILQQDQKLLTNPIF